MIKMVRLFFSLIISFLPFTAGLSQIASLNELAGGKAKPDKISVSDFGAVPDDGKDDSKAILAAIAQAKAAGIHKVCFEAGKYEFKSIPGWERTERKRLCLYDHRGFFQT